MRQFLLAFLALIALAGPAAAEPVLMISIDGLRPGDVIEAEARGLKLPNLRRFVSEGTYASGVVGVLPTVTYPSHTTLITGTSPARHGITHNLAFDPQQINDAGWTWYASDIKTQTIWEAASRAGIKVANVHWPVSVGAKGVAWNLPQIWRTGHADDAKLLTTLASPGLVAELEKLTREPYPLGIDETVEGDEARGRFAEALIRRHKPGFITVYLAGLDHQQHQDGPGTPTAHAVLERLDAVVGKLVATQLATQPDAVIAVVSDHGFLPVSKETSLYHMFIDEGLIRLDGQGKITSWDVALTTEDGVAMIMLARPDDQALKARVLGLVERLKADPRSGIDRIIDKGGLAKLGGDPTASLLVTFLPGTAVGDFGAAVPLYGQTRSKGTHGYMPDEPAMQSTFMMMGRAIPRGRNLGVIDMRAIAPTLAQIMGAKMDEAEKPAIAITK